MIDQTLVARLAQHRAISNAPTEEHVWLAERGVLHTLAVGEVLTRKGEQAVALHIILSGRITIRVDRGAGAHKVIEWTEGDVGGAMPYSRGASPPGDAMAEEPTEVLGVERAQFPELIRECPAVTATLVHAMLDRARQFRSGDHRDEKLLSLGKLAAGLAHELNNPASAAIRSARALTEGVAEAEAAARRLGAARLSDAQFSAIDSVRDACLTSGAPQGYSTLARADREDTFGDWLGAHGASELSAAPLAETGVTLEALDALAATVSGDALDAALRWIAAGCQVRTLTAHIQTSASRISDLVGAVKGFTFMDHALTPEPVDVRSGITDTLTMLGAKISAKSAQISVHLDPDLPRAIAVGAELNQVWINLLDNALDAIPSGGRVEVTAGSTSARVVVQIVDDGPGIPAEIQGRIFDPFFTTKGVGKGTGLGLDIVRRLVKQHDGEIEVESRPGRTEFRVILRAERQAGGE